MPLQIGEDFADLCNTVVATPNSPIEIFLAPKWLRASPSARTRNKTRTCLDMFGHNWIILDDIFFC